MTLDQYSLEWQADAPIPADDLDGSARHVPILHAKYWRFYSAERLRFKKFDLEWKVLYRNKVEYYTGKMVDEDRLKLGWEPNPRKILSAHLSTYIDADPHVQAHQKEKALVEETLKFLEDVIKSINGRGFLINSSISFLKFKMGV